MAGLTVIHCAQGGSKEIPIHAALHGSAHLQSALQHHGARLEHPLWSKVGDTSEKHPASHLN